MMQVCINITANDCGSWGVNDRRLYLNAYRLPEMQNTSSASLFPREIYNIHARELYSLCFSSCQSFLDSCAQPEGRHAATCGFGANPAGNSYGAKKDQSLAEALITKAYVLRGLTCVHAEASASIEVPVVSSVSSTCHIRPWTTPSGTFSSGYICTGRSEQVKQHHGT